MLSTTIPPGATSTGIEITISAVVKLNCASRHPTTRIYVHLCGFVDARCCPGSPVGQFHSNNTTIMDLEPRTPGQMSIDGLQEAHTSRLGLLCCWAMSRCTTTKYSSGDSTHSLFDETTKWFDNWKMWISRRRGNGRWWVVGRNGRHSLLCGDLHWSPAFEPCPGCGLVFTHNENIYARGERWITIWIIVFAWFWDVVIKLDITDVCLTAREHGQ